MVNNIDFSHIETSVYNGCSNFLNKSRSNQHDRKRPDTQISDRLTIVFNFVQHDKIRAQYRAYQTSIYRYL